VPYFTSAADVHASIARLFGVASADPQVGPRLTAVQAVMAFHCSCPSTLVTVRLADPVAAWLGAGPERADLHLYLTSDDAFDLLSGRGSVTMAVAKGHVRAVGAVDKLVEFAPIIPAMARVTAPLERTAGQG
jgi:hypothetical protein